MHVTQREYFDFLSIRDRGTFRQELVTLRSRNTLREFLWPKNSIQLCSGALEPLQWPDHALTRILRHKTLPVRIWPQNTWLRSENMKGILRSTHTWHLRCTVCRFRVTLSWVCLDLLHLLDVFFFYRKWHTHSKKLAKTIPSENHQEAQLSQR